MIKCLLTEWGRAEQENVQLVLVHDTWTSLRPILTSWPWGKYFAVQPSNSVNKYIIYWWEYTGLHKYYKCFCFKKVIFILECWTTLFHVKSFVKISKKFMIEVKILFRSIHFIKVSFNWLTKSITFGKGSKFSSLDEQIALENWKIVKWSKKA